MNVLTETKSVKNKMSTRELADLIQKHEDEQKEEAKARRTLVKLYGFDAAKSGFGGFSRISNVLIDEFYRFKAVNLETGKLITDANGQPKFAKDSGNGETDELEPKSLEPLELYIFLQLLKKYLLTTNMKTVPISKNQVSEQIGKSYSAVRASFKKLEDLGYIKKQEARVGVKGGSIRTYDIRPFMTELAKHAYKRRLEYLASNEEQLSEEGLL
jgi:predicted transcriptional regulator